MDPARPHRVSATGAAFTGVTGHQYVMQGARLIGGAANATTAVLRETDGSGAVLAELQAVTGSSDAIEMPVQFVTAVHVTLGGVGAACIVYV